MDSVKARITGDGIDTSVEFSVEEVIPRQQGKPWDDMDDAHQLQTMKDYALDLVSREDGISGDLEVTLEGGSFSRNRQTAYISVQQLHKWKMLAVRFSASWSNSVTDAC